MTEQVTLDIINKIFKSVFGCENTWDLNLLLEKMAFDIKLPKQVRDTFTNVITWTDSINGTKFITNNNMEKRDTEVGWMLPKREVHNLQDIINIWQEVNVMTTERVYDSMDVVNSDTIYRCEKVYRSSSCSDSKSIIYCDSCSECEYLLASQRSGNCNFCIRVDDSKNCSNSYSVICSNKISNSLFIQDCYDLNECLFCSHIASKRFCIANMQFEEYEYFEIKEKIIKWILNS